MKNDNSGNVKRNVKKQQQDKTDCVEFYESRPLTNLRTNDTKLSILQQLYSSCAVGRCKRQRSEVARKFAHKKAKMLPTKRQ